MSRTGWPRMSEDLTIVLFGLFCCAIGVVFGVNGYRNGHDVGWRKGHYTGWRDHEKAIQDELKAIEDERK